MQLPLKFSLPNFKLTSCVVQRFLVLVGQLKIYGNKIQNFIIDNNFIFDAFYMLFKAAFITIPGWGLLFFSNYYSEPAAVVADAVKSFRDWQSYLVLL